MDIFEKIIRPGKEEVILDVGGYPGTWTTRPQKAQRVDCLNVHPVDWEPSDFPEHRIATLVGDGCALPFEKDSYDILFSNSVIEHVGDWEKQKEFAREARRVGKKLWIQTPAYECPIEPHFLALFVHWFPVRIRRRLLRWVTLWGWLSKPSQKTIDETIATTRLLNKARVKELFPDCTIVTERMFGVLVKSYIVYRV